MIYPNVYATVNQKKRATIITLVCVVIGIVTSLHEINQKFTVYCLQSFSYEVAMLATIGLVQIVLEYVRVIVRATAVILLTVLTLAVWSKYRQIEAKRKLMTSSRNGTSENQLRPLQLLTLQIVQSMTLLVTNFPVLYFYLNFYILTPAGCDTLGQSAYLYSQIANATARVGRGVNFIFYIGLSRIFVMQQKSYYRLGLQE